MLLQAASGSFSGKKDSHMDISIPGKLKQRPEGWGKEDERKEADFHGFSKNEMTSRLVSL